MYVQHFYFSRQCPTRVAKVNFKIKPEIKIRAKIQEWTEEFSRNAKFYFNKVSQNYVAYFIHNLEDEVYEVIDQDRYDDYDGDFDLDMRVIDFSH